MDEGDGTIPGSGPDRQLSERNGEAVVGGLDFELLAASLRADTSDMRIWIEVLATKLERALPGRVQVHRGGLFGKRAVQQLEIELGAWRLSLRVEHQYPVAERIHIVRGIALKTEQLPVDAWIICLSQALSELAATSAREQAAIQSLLR
jgi:hypothetical protein